LLLATGIAACSREPYYVVEKIEDGDTIVVKIDGKSQRIQLAGIDAPEDTENPKFKLDVKTKGINEVDLLGIGQAATTYLKSQLAAGEKVTFQDKLAKPDKYGRIPAIVLLHHESLNLRMVQQGYAVVLNRYPLEATFKSALEKAEKQARSSKKGLWKNYPEIMLKWGT
jgi:micrococcal nuclease